MPNQANKALVFMVLLSVASSCGDTGTGPNSDAATGGSAKTGGMVVGGSTAGGGSKTGGNTGGGATGGITTGGSTMGGANTGGTPVTGGTLVITPVGTGGIKGATEFVTEDPVRSAQDGGVGKAADAPASTGAGGATSAGPQPSAPTIDGASKGAEAAPAGRVAEVEEADIYKIEGTKLLYFNTYRGFLVFDIADPKNPKPISRLPVFGYPVEMFVQGTTVFALLRDSLYLTQVNGKLQFERRNVSQLVTIDITDAANPKLIQSMDIIGQLREGVSRKIENTIYVVSYMPQSYYYGWAYSRGTTPATEQAWVYSFDVSDPKVPKKVGEEKIFEGGSVQFNSQNLNYTKRFNSIAISATSNALMVVENWYVNAYASGLYTCGAYESNQQSVVSLIDISNPQGKIRRHTRFETFGTVSDQFKMTYVADEATKTGTFYGIFARQVWSSVGCRGTFFTQNSLEAWDVTNGDAPVRLSRLDFGKPNETVRGTAFDVTRKVAYAITAQRIDPLYAISIADPKNLKILSAVDGLSGDMSVFRLIADRNFLMAVGTDTSGTCTGFDTGTGRQATKIAVSIIDVRDLTKVRLVQRQCVAVENAAWGTSSAVTSNLDQAHKMIGMHSDATANVITVPVYYYRKSDASNWWWYQYETAVGIMSWDLAKYDDTKPETQQNVIANHGTFIHPNGEVRRTIVFTHPVTQKRTMLNLSDTHATMADLSDLAKPTLHSTMEIAPFYSEIFRFGDYLVEHVQTKPYSYNYQEPHEFRVRKAVGGLSEAPLARFTVGQVQRVIKQGNNLVLMRQANSALLDGRYVNTVTALVYDLSNPVAPRAAGQTVLPTQVMPYYRYYCGWSWWNGYWFDTTTTWTSTDRGILFLNTTWNYSLAPYTTTYDLISLDLSNPDSPKVSTRSLPSLSEPGTTRYYYTSYNTSPGLVPDPVDPTGFYITYRTRGEEVTKDGYVWAQSKHFAQRWSFAQAEPAPVHTVNLPGPLVATWSGPSGERMYMTREQAYVKVQNVNYPASYYYQADTRLALLRAVEVAGKNAAEYLDGYTFSGVSLSALVRQGNLWLLTGRLNNYNYYYTYPAVDPKTAAPTWEQTSDRFIVFDASQNKLTKTYDQPTKAYNLSIMGTQKDRVFVNLQGDGILVVDTKNPAAPTGVSFLRTLGYATHLENFGDDLYIASGYFGLEHRNLNQLPDLPQ